MSAGGTPMNEKETALVRLVCDFPEVIEESARLLNPSLIANYLYDLSREFNQFYHDYSILSAGDPGQVALRLQLTAVIGKVIRDGMELLGIEVPERM